MAHRRVGGAAASLAVLALTSCGTQPEPTSSPAADDAATLGHVHGLGVDPADGVLYVASHHGVFRITGTTRPERVADRWQDTMAFTVSGPGQFLASGHPDLREDLPTHLGLIESTDAARTWQALSLQGEADFHALDTTGDRVYGYDSVTRRLLTTTDRTTWRPLAEDVTVIDLAANPANSQEVILTTASGRMLHVTLSGADPEVLSGPPLALVAWPTPGLLIGVTADGTIYTSTDAGGRWLRVGSTPGPPDAFDATPEVWHAATSSGIHRSTDSGRSWEPVLGD